MTNPMTTLLLSRLPARVLVTLRRAAVLMVAPLSLTACLDVVNPQAGRAITTPAPVFGTVSFKDVSAGFFHTCALTAAGSAYCWGSNQWGQVGTNAVLPSCDLGTCSLVPVTSGDSRVFRAIATGTTHTCGIAADAFTYCWGGTSLSTAPILGDGVSITSNSGIRVRTDSLFTQVTLGGGHSCGLTASGVALCWGRNEFGQLGDSSLVARGLPVRVVTTLRFTRLSAGSDFTCGLTSGGAIYCWGSNAFGQLGTGDVTFNVPRATLLPALVSGGGSWSAIASGGSHACALSTAGRVSCWGRNDNANQLGDSTLVSHRGVPGPVKSALTFAEVSAGAGTTCARTAGGDAWCWGGNAFGGVGNGRSANAGEPVPSKTLAGPYSLVVAGGSHSCGIETSGIVKCWGDSRYGALGIR